MISQEMLKEIKAGEPIIYEGINYTWYSGIVKQTMLNGNEILGLEVAPTDIRLDTDVSKIWDSSGNIYRVSEQVLLGQETRNNVRKLLEAATPQQSRFHVNRIMAQLDTIVANYYPLELLSTGESIIIK